MQSATPFSLLVILLPLLICTSCRSIQGPGGGEREVAQGWIDSPHRLSSHEATRLKTEAHLAQQEGNREVCGAILQDADGSLGLCFADNDSRRAHSYTLSDKSVRRIEAVARDSNATIIGSFHSHPSSDAQPGASDLHYAGLHSLMLIHSVRTGETRLWKVVWRDGRKKAREVELRIFGRRPRGASPLPPSRRKPVPDGRDARLR